MSLLRQLKMADLVSKILTEKHAAQFVTFSVDGDVEIRVVVSDIYGPGTEVVTAFDLPAYKEFGHLIGWDSIAARQASTPEIAWDVFIKRLTQQFDEWQTTVYRRTGLNIDLVEVREDFVKWLKDRFEMYLFQSDNTPDEWVLMKRVNQSDTHAVVDESISVRKDLAQTFDIGVEGYGDINLQVIPEFQNNQWLQSLVIVDGDKRISTISKDWHRIYSYSEDDIKEMRHKLKEVLVTRIRELIDCKGYIEVDPIMEWIESEFPVSFRDSNNMYTREWRYTIPTRQELTHQVMDESSDGWDWIAVDGDHVGDAAATPLLDDDEVEAAHVSDLIHQGQTMIQKWCIDRGGIMVVNGGDNALFKMKPQGYYDARQHYGDILDKLRSLYRELTGFTLSCGVGHLPSESDKALIVAKSRGRDRIVFYDDDVEKDYQITAVEMRESSDMDPFIDQLLTEAESGASTSYQTYKQRQKSKASYFKPSKIASALASQALKKFKGAGKDEEAMVLRMSRRVAKRLSMSDVVARKLITMIRRYETNGSPASKDFIQLLGGVKMAREVRRFLDTSKNL